MQQEVRLAMTHDTARALTEAGYISVADYLRLCTEHGWTVKDGRE
jgi:hypothetical protein